MEDHDVLQGWDQAKEENERAGGKPASLGPISRRAPGNGRPATSDDADEDESAHERQPPDDVDQAG